MRLILCSIFGVIFILSCSQKMVENPKNEQEFLSKIEQLEKAVLKNSIDQDSSKLFLNDSLASTLEQFIEKYPKSKNRAVCLDKLQMFYSSNGLYQFAVKKADQLITEYPNYPNRALVIESQIANYEFFVIPRDTNQIKKYINLLLADKSLLTKEKVTQYEKRLKNIQLPLDEIINVE